MTDKKPKNLLLQISVIVSLIGFLDALYLYYMEFTGYFACLINAGVFQCATVGQSIYSKLPPGNGIPVSLLGCIFFIVVIGILFLALYTKNEYWLSFFLPVAGLLGVIFSIYLTIIEIFVIKFFCEFCVLSAICSLAFFILILVAKKKNFPTLFSKLDFWNMFREKNQS